jgi:hypothetical protein
MMTEEAPPLRFEVDIGEAVGIGTADVMERKEDSAAAMESEVDLVEVGVGF